MRAEEIASELEKKGWVVKIEDEDKLKVKRVFKHVVLVLEPWKEDDREFPLLAVRTPFMHDAPLPLEAINAFNNAMPPLIRLVRFEHEPKLVMAESAVLVAEPAQISAWLRIHEAMIIKCVIPFLGRFEVDWAKALDEIMEEDDDECGFLRRFPKN